LNYANILALKKRFYNESKHNIKKRHFWVSAFLTSKTRCLSAGRFVDKPAELYKIQYKDK
jgi:hypothetical protein